MILFLFETCTLMNIHVVGSAVAIYAVIHQNQETTQSQNKSLNSVIFLNLLSEFH